MVRPVLQDNFLVMVKGCFHISGLWGEVIKTSGPDGIRAYLSHQVFGF
ncbi:hypothetical protein IMCC21906_02284 [Spongiibacter sp. IMCC21906]|jgi:hypothetical protein|nr:hypothetical protein IMCC21906_02284 [Spongiibacter sp. IMCC21906]